MTLLPGQSVLPGALRGVVQLASRVDNTVAQAAATARIQGRTMADDVIDYRVDLDAFSGPLDLLLYLVRRQEVEILDLPIARITAQFLDFLEVLQALDL